MEQLKIASEKAELEERRKAVETAENNLIYREIAINRQEQIIEDREQEVNKREVKLMRFMNSEIGKSAMREYENSIRKSDANLLSLRQGKRIGKLGLINEVTNER